MQPDTILCRRCGAANTGGDQFCGSCGAFLEWEGDAAPAPESTAAPLDPPPLEPAPAPEPAAAPAPAPEPESGPLPTPGFAVCPSCGSGNPPGRTFCHSCGKLLSQTPAGATGGAAADAKGDGERSRGLPGWLPIVIGAGLVVGIVVVLVTVVLRPSAPPSAAVASATLTPTLSIPPSVPQASAAAPSVGLASGVPGESVQLTLTGASASSVAADTPDVAAINVIDGRLDTRWEEAIGSAPGEWVEVTFAESRLDYLVIYSGFQLSHDSFLATRRPQNVVVTVNGGAPVGFVLADSELPQRIDIDDVPDASVVRVQVASTFPATASAYPGSPIDAAAISEIRAFGSAGG